MPIYNVETPDGNILKIEGPEGASEDQLLGFAAAQYYGQQPVEEKPVAAPKPEGRTWGEAATDVGASFLSGIGGLAQMPGQVGMLAGMYKPEEAGTGLQGMGKQLEEYGQSLKSKELQAKEQAPTMPPTIGRCFAIRRERPRSIVRLGLPGHLQMSGCSTA